MFFMTRVKKYVMRYRLS